MQIDSSFLKQMPDKAKYRVVVKSDNPQQQIAAIETILAAMVADGKQSETVRDFAHDVVQRKGISLTHGARPYVRIVQAMQEAYQDFDYVHDPDGVEMFQTPRRTILARRGDCDCMAASCASALAALGFPTAVALTDSQGRGVLTHAMCAVKPPMAANLQVISPKTGKYATWRGGEWRVLELTKRRAMGWFPEKSTVLRIAGKTYPVNRHL